MHPASSAALIDELKKIAFQPNVTTGLSHLHGSAAALQMATSCESQPKLRLSSWAVSSEG